MEESKALHTRSPLSRDGRGYTTSIPSVLPGIKQHLSFRMILRVSSINDGVQLLSSTFNLTFLRAELLRPPEHRSSIVDWVATLEFAACLCSPTTRTRCSLCLPRSWHEKAKTLPHKPQNFRVRLEGLRRSFFGDKTRKPTTFHTSPRGYCLYVGLAVDLE